MSALRHTLAETRPTARPRAVTILLWVGQALLFVGFTSAGVFKLIADPIQVEMFEHIGLGMWLMYLTGTLELLGAIGLLIPRLSGLAATGLVGIMVGATFANLFAIPGAALFALETVAFAIVAGLIAWGRWPHTKSLAALVRNVSVVRAPMAEA